MPDGPSGGRADKSAGSPPNNERKPSQPAISDDALAALERHYGAVQDDAFRNDSDAASATGFAAILAQGGGGAVEGSSGSLSATGSANESFRRDSAEIPEAKIISESPDSGSAPTTGHIDDVPHPAEERGVPEKPDEPSAQTHDEPVIYASAPVDEADDLALQDASNGASSSPAVNRIAFKRPTGMPEHYKALIPVLFAMGLVALAIGVWAVVHLTSGHGSGGDSSSARGASMSHVFAEIALLGLPLGFVMLGLTGFIFKRYWGKK